jgi:glycosyltransferase involved in cell wall biosynthesis
MFTFCLVTKGRRDYLGETLDSLKAALGESDVNIIIIDNGCSPDISDSLKQWCAQFDDRAKYIRFEINETAWGARVWDTLQNMNVDWISFPGDDDVVRPEFIGSLRLEIEKNPNLVAAAASMRVIDSKGRKSGEIRHPAQFDGGIPNYLAGALSEPPFLFPSLFFKFSVVKGGIPGSRYVFDWWLSLNLIISGVVMTTREIAIDYRVHESQESALAPKRRKYFEAQLVFSRFISSPTFDGFISGLTSKEIALFWLGLVRSKPIYQDQEFGNYLLVQLGGKLAESVSDNEIADQILGELAGMNGVLLRTGEIRGFTRRTSDSSSHSSQNFELIPSDSACPSLTSLIMESSQNSKVETSFFVGCEHSKNRYDFLIDCKVTTEERANWLDKFIVQITEELESSGRLSFTITPIERMFITRVRQMRNRIPISLLDLLKRLVMRSGRIE